ncbi:MAG TPA: DUF819 family protein [Bacteroidales bacterium]|nr:DUF819 family protein [Bacteroidales bacterium]HOS58090.1 DUF819 family protein [Bacteroidales bacterium]HRT13993.1 DUF819 family protein [Bacteroidales bacterium]
MAHSLIILAIYLITPVIIIFLFRKYGWVRSVGTVILAYAVGIIMALAGVIPPMEYTDPETLVVSKTLMGKIQTWVMNITVPLAIPLMLFSSDFRLWTKSLPKTILALVGGVISIIVAVVAGFFLFRNSGIEDINNVAAMMTAIYTGGTLNFFALGSALQVDPNTITLTYTFEMLVTFPSILFIVGGGYKVFRKILPFKDESTDININMDIEDDVFENYKGMFSRKTFPKMMIGLLISIVMLIIGAGLSLAITGKLNELIIILTITTLAIAASFSKYVRTLPKTFELGMFFILIFSVVVASQFDIYSVNTSALSMLWFILFIMLTSVVLHLILSRIFKVSGDLFTVAHIGLLCSPPFIPPIVAAMGNRKVLISGIVIGLIGYAIGTYLGVAISYFFNLF